MEDSIMKITWGHPLEKHLNEQRSPLPPAYLLIGKDPWQTAVAKELLWEKLSLDKRPCTHLREKEATKTRLTAELENLDLFSGERLLLISEAQDLTKDLQNFLATYLASPQASLLIVLIAESLPPSSPLLKAMEAYGVVITQATLRGQERHSLCCEWLIKRANTLGKTVTHAAADLLVRYVDVDYQLLIQELNKAIAYVGKRPQLTEKDIAAISQALPNGAFWELGDQVLGRDFPAAFKLIQRLQQAGHNLIPIVRQLRRQLTTAFELLTLPTEEIPRRYPQLKEFIIAKQRRQAAGYGVENLPSALIACDACELSYKNGCSDEALLLEQLLHRLNNNFAPPLSLPLGTRYE